MCVNQKLESCTLIANEISKKWIEIWIKSPATVVPGEKASKQSSGEGGTKPHHER